MAIHKYTSGAEVQDYTYYKYWLYLFENNLLSYISYEECIPTFLLIRFLTYTLDIHYVYTLQWNLIVHTCSARF